MSVRDRIRGVKHLRNRYLVCVLENPGNIMNIASAIRNISAFGVEKLYIVGGSDTFRDFESSRNNKRLTNLSVGANKWVFVKHFESTEECIAHLKKNLYTIAVTSSHVKGKKNVDLYQGTYSMNRLAVWFGNETYGVSKEVIDSSDMCIQIPMGGVVESLNLGTSTGIILSYIGYQRLKHFFNKGRLYSKPKGLARIKMSTWKNFFDLRK